MCWFYTNESFLSRQKKVRLHLLLSKLNIFFLLEDDEEQEEEDFPEENDSIAEETTDEADGNNPGKYWHHFYFLIYLVLFYEKYCWFFKQTIKKNERYMFCSRVIEN